MSSNLLEIQLDYLAKLYNSLPKDLEDRLPAIRRNDSFHFRAFGEDCIINPKGISFNGRMVNGPRGVLIALYANSVPRDFPQLGTVKSFKQFRGAVAYYSTFAARSENSLIPYADLIRQYSHSIISNLDGHENKVSKGYFSFTLYPLPKIPMHYICYPADDEFPASITCLFAANAESFMPVAGLADVSEYTAQKIIELISKVA
jgi:Domain of unknown function (DUF3786)